MKLPAETVRVSVEPAVEPVTRAEAILHSRISNTAEYDSIDRMIKAARQVYQQDTGRVLISQTLTGGLKAWPGDGVLRLPYGPLQSVTSITYVDDDDVVQTVAATVYAVDTKRDLIYLKDSQSWPSGSMRGQDPITVTWVAGYGDAESDLRELDKQAVLLMFGTLYEQREGIVVGAGLTMNQVAYDRIVMLDRAHYYG